MGRAFPPQLAEICNDFPAQRTWLSCELLQAQQPRLRPAPPCECRNLLTGRRPWRPMLQLCLPAMGSTSVHLVASRLTATDLEVPSWPECPELLLLLFLLNVEINVSLTENDSRTRYTIKIKQKLRKWVLDKKAFQLSFERQEWALSWHYIQQLQIFKTAGFFLPTLCLVNAIASKLPAYVYYYTTYILGFLFHSWQVFLFDLSRPISTVTFCCTGTITDHVILMQSTIS